MTNACGWHSDPEFPRQGQEYKKTLAVMLACVASDLSSEEATGQQRKKRTNATLYSEKTGLGSLI